MTLKNKKLQQEVNDLRLVLSRQEVYSCAPQEEKPELQKVLKQSKNKLQKEQYWQRRKSRRENF